MNRFTSTLAIALVSTAGFAASALAQDKQAAPAQGDAGAATTMKKTGDAAAQQQVPQGGVRDWAAIDKNNDNLISPQEMEAALKEVGPQAKPAK